MAVTIWQQYYSMNTLDCHYNGVQSVVLFVTNILCTLHRVMLYNLYNFSIILISSAAQLICKIWMLQWKIFQFQIHQSFLGIWRSMEWMTELSNFCYIYNVSSPFHLSIMSRSKLYLSWWWADTWSSAIMLKPETSTISADFQLM